MAMTSLLPVFGLFFALLAEPSTIDVFVPKNDGFASIRIPSVVVSNKGTVLAFAEGRAADADQAKNKIILKRSVDGGKTWGKLTAIATDGDRALNNPCAVVERESGQVLLMYQSYPAGIGERSGKIQAGHEGDLIVRNWLITSSDDGVTWSKPRDITKETKREKIVTTIAGGPGIGIQLRHGKHAGRILIPFNEGPFGMWNIYAAYSDDKGKSWKMGDVAPGGLIEANDKKTSTVNEAQFAELKDGSIRFNVRRWAGKAVRKTCVSKDGGTTWTKVEDVPEQIDPSCMASIFRYTGPKGDQSLLLFSGPQSTKRENGTVFASYDEGKTWPVKRVLCQGSFAYSCLTALADGTIGCLYEAEGTSKVVFARFTLEWLTNGKGQIGKTKTEQKPTSEGAATITTTFPGGNVIVQSTEGNSVHLTPDLRGDNPWFYWYFEATALKPGRVRFVFPEKVAGFVNGAIGFQGPAISNDGGRSWRWMGTDTVKDNAFTYDFIKQGEVVRFAVTIPYLKSDFDSFRVQHSKNPHMKISVLTKSRAGREVELLRIGSPGPGKEAILITARHHSAETIASYVLEGVIEEALSDTPDGQDFRKRYVLYAVPFVDKDGVENGDQGKNRKPHDHNRDYGENSIYPEIQAIKELHAVVAFRYALDLHCPTLRMEDHQVMFFLGSKSKPANNHTNVSVFAERIKSGLPITAPYGPLNWLKDEMAPPSAFSYYFGSQAGVAMATTLEIPFSPPNKPTDPASCRQYGRVLAQAIVGTRFINDPPKQVQEAAFSIPVIDLNDQKERQTLVDREKGQYLGHPTTLLLEDGKTILCVYPKGHGRGPILYKRSPDGGKTWSERLATPKNWETSQETPTIHRVVDAKGAKRLILFSGLNPCRMAFSEDDGKSWSELKAVGDWGGIVTMASVIGLKTGAGQYMALFHDDGRFIKKGGKATNTSTLYKSLSMDGGLTWSAPETIFKSNKVFLCEPGAIRSPDGKQIAVLLRENFHQKNSHTIFSNDEGKTWTEPRELAASLNGDRHVAKYGPDGRLFISFRDIPTKGQFSPTANSWVGWVGTYDDLIKCKEGQYRIHFKKNYKSGDCAYPGIELLPDGTFVVTTYGHWTPNESPYILSMRFTFSEVDEMAKKQIGKKEK